MTEQQSSTHS